MLNIETLLLVTVIIIVLYLLWKSQSAQTDSKEVAKFHNSTAAVDGQSSCTPEASATKENIEHFTVCAMPTDMNCDGVGNLGENPFGAPGLTYNDYVLANGVDNGTVTSHAEFVKDRVENYAYWTGKTMTPDSHDSYDPTPWVGIRGRPQRVPVCNPTQVTDVDYDLYPDKQQLKW